MSSSQSLDGQVVILAGGTGRVGGATLATLLRTGASVAVISRDLERGREAVQRERGGAPDARIRVIPADLTDAASAEHAVGEAVSHYGRIDAVLSLAGGGSAWSRIVDSTPEMLAVSIRNNLAVAYNLMVPALRAMLAEAPRPGARSRGRLLAVTAGSSLDPAPSRGLMGVGKAGVNTLMRAIAREHKADGIVANAVILGGVATDAAREYLSPDDFSAAASPQEVADVLTFHASDMSSGINGELIHLNAREVD